MLRKVTTAVVAAASWAMSGSAWAMIPVPTKANPTATAVPEINATEGMAAVAVLVATLLIVREMFLRRRTV